MIKGKFIAKKPGHFANTEFAKQIRQVIKFEQKNGVAPIYHPDQKPIYDINDIMKLLPHRPPFLLIDKIIEITDTSVVGVKCVTMNEPFFVGHFPQEPVMPGVLQIEAMAQAGGILVLKGLEKPQEWSTYFLKIDNVKFKRKVRQRTPGLRHVYNVHLKKKPGFQGKVTLRFTIAPGGEIISIAVVGSTTGFNDFDNEIKKTVKRWTFSKVKSGNTTVTIPFTFTE